jgi:hypothetical protein
MRNEISLYIPEQKDIRSIMSFLKKFWKKNHILSKDLKVFKYFYLEKKKINFIVAKYQSKIIGVMGFIPNSRYSKKNVNKFDIIWPSVLCINAKFSGVGLKIFNFYHKKFKQKNFGLINFNINAKNFYRIFNYELYKMKHYYMINKLCDDLKILKKKKKITNKALLKNCKITFKLIEKKNFNLLKIFKDEFKNNKYIINKYIKNPFYKYKCVLIKINSKKNVLLVFRKIKILKTSIIRIIDFVGSPKDFEKLNSLFNYILNENNSEYVDLVVSENFKFNPNNVGFIEKTNEIVPSYFEPFIKKNITHLCGYNTRVYKNLFIFKGDGDSERPNKI